MFLVHPQYGKNIDYRKLHKKNNIRYFVWLLIAALTMASFGAPAAAEQILVFRSIEDQSTPPDESFCSFSTTIPFKPNVLLGASLWSIETRASDAKIVNDQVHQVGNATACTQITNFNFPTFTTVPFYIRFDLEDAQYVGLGDCTIISNSVPVNKLILAGCSLNLTNVPPDVKGGAATSLSVFNPFRLSGFSTGSIWTLHLY